MDELDQLLQDLSAPKAQTYERTSVTQAPAQQKAAPVVVEQAKPQKLDFNELDSLMAELGTGSVIVKPAPSAPAPAAAAPAPKPSGAAASVDDLLAELTASTSAPPKAAVGNQPAATSTHEDELDSMLSSLQGLSTAPAVAAAQPAPAAAAPAPAAASRRNNELDNILNSLASEMNEIGAAGDFKGQCALCKKAVSGQPVTALGKTWHQEHFACLQCRKQLNSQTFFDKDGMPYCEKCYHDMFAPKCAYCDGPIRERCVNALNKTWHPDHFFCSQCGKHFTGGGFMEKDGKAYCEEDYFNMFAPKCGGCEKPIMADCISGLGRQWHPTCFVCMDCRQPFTGSFFEYENKPYCEKHYHSQKGSLCASCQKPVVGRCVTALGKKFHPEHFVCAFCMKQLAKGTFKENTGKAYCMPCHVKLWG